MKTNIVDKLITKEIERKKILLMSERGDNYKELIRADIIELENGLKKINTSS